MLRGSRNRPRPWIGYLAAERHRLSQGLRQCPREGMLNSAWRVDGVRPAFVPKHDVHLAIGLHVDADEGTGLRRHASAALHRLTLHGGAPVDVAYPGPSF